MGLQLVNTVNTTSAAVSIDITGITTDDPYLLVVDNFHSTQNNDNIYFRVLKSGTSQSDNEYDYAYKVLSSTSFSTRDTENDNKAYLFENVSTGGGSAIVYLYNFNKSGDFSTALVNSVSHVSNQTSGSSGSFIHTVSSASNGLRVQGSQTSACLTGNLNLYKVI